MQSTDITILRSLSRASVQRLVVDPPAQLAKNGRQAIAPALGERAATTLIRLALADVVQQYAVKQALPQIAVRGERVTIADPSVAQLSRLLGDALQAVFQALGQLRPGSSNDVVLRQALEQLTRQLAARLGIGESADLSTDPSRRRQIAEPPLASPLATPWQPPGISRRKRRSRSTSSRPGDPSSEFDAVADAVADDDTSADEPITNASASSSKDTLLMSIVDWLREQGHAGDYDEHGRRSHGAGVAPGSVVREST
ncbi:MAG: hypothetical protein AAF270_07670 [Pseudomonadota bacterium]